MTAARGQELRHLRSPQRKQAVVVRALAAIVFRILHHISFPILWNQEIQPVCDGRNVE